MESISPIRSARDFVQSRVQRPALQNSALSDTIKNKVRHSDIWINQFKKVGDLYNYLLRFSIDKNDSVYLEMTKLGLKTFEDITADFAEKYKEWLGDCTRPSNFVVGDKYSNHDLQIFARNYDIRSGGMFVVGEEDQQKVVVIKATFSGGKYANQWISPQDHLKYYFKSITQHGVPVFGKHFKANAEILNDHEIPILTFTRSSEGDLFTFHGVFKYKAHHTEPDQSRWFELTYRSDQPLDVIIGENYLNQNFSGRLKKSLKDPRADRLKRLAQAPKKPAKITVQSIAYDRNADVVAEVLFRADGRCERCTNKAPFYSRSRNAPYLEVHHKVRLADGGDDTVENAIALCPNCHRELHFG